MTEQSKKTAAYKSVEYVKEGMLVGLGTGSTVKYAIEAIGKRVKDEGLNIVGIPTSKATEELASSLNIELATLEDYSEIDLCIDGADEVDKEFNLIKGGGGAHLREKIVAKAARNFIVVVDSSKMVERIGQLPVPVEFLPYAKKFVANELRKIGGSPQLRSNYETDNGNLVFDTKFYINNPLELEQKINSIPGVVENGIFSSRKPDLVIIGDGEKIKILKNG